MYQVAIYFKENHPLVQEPKGKQVSNFLAFNRGTKFNTRHSCTVQDLRNFCETREYSDSLKLDEPYLILQLDDTQVDISFQVCITTKRLCKLPPDNCQLLLDDTHKVYKSMLITDI